MNSAHKYSRYFNVYHIHEWPATPGELMTLGASGNRVKDLENNQNPDMDRFGT